MTQYLFNELYKLLSFKIDLNTAIMTDVDGTISKIVSNPEDAVVSDSMKELLAQLNKKFKIVGVISGRPLSQVTMMVGVEGLFYSGSHGLEYLKDGKIITVKDAEKYRPFMQELVQKLKNEDSLNIEGLELENKGICLSLHYRKCKKDPELGERIFETVNQVLNEDKLRIDSGRKIVELKPPLIQDKGTILEKIVKEYSIKKLIYLGDDITDFDAFSKLKELEHKRKIESATILVSSREIPDFIKNCAQFYVNNVWEVQKFFKWLIS
ncbi:MAG: trehalose-phosphatase [Methanobacterium sp.]|nr:MAG: trehalose-phosphatase [Methanobacterium sp.]